jgi:rsbT antagonist protein RsbS
VSDAQVSIIQLWDVLLVPLMGDVADHHAEQISDVVLDRIAKHGPRGLVLDLSGVSVVDSHLCSLMANLAAAAGLMGTRAFISGISAEVAMTLQTMGVTFHNVETTRGLEDALSKLNIARLEELA